MLNYGGFGIPFGAAMLNFADDPRGFYHFVAIDDSRALAHHPPVARSAASGPFCTIIAPCGLRLLVDHAKSDGCGVVSQSFRSSARALRPEARRQISRDSRDPGLRGAVSGLGRSHARTPRARPGGEGRPLLFEKAAASRSVPSRVEEHRERIGRHRLLAGDSSLSPAIRSAAQPGRALSIARCSIRSPRSPPIWPSSAHFAFDLVRALNFKQSFQNRCKKAGRESDTSPEPQCLAP